jgi:hypothetical protein
VIVYGKNAGRLLRDGMTLEAREVDLLPLGRPAKKDQTTGTLKVISRPGDFIVAQWEGTPAPANAAFSFAPRPAKSMFD